MGVMTCFTHRWSGGTPFGHGAVIPAYSMCTKGRQTQSSDAILWALPVKVRQSFTETVLRDLMDKANSLSSNNRDSRMVATTPSGTTVNVAPIQLTDGPN